MNAKKILGTFMVGIVLSGTFLTCGRSLANDFNNKSSIEFEKIYRNDISQSLGIDTNISVSEYITINNENIPLYCTFEDKSQALEEIKVKANNLLNKIKDKYSIEEDLNEENWKIYRGKSNQYITECEAEGQDKQEYWDLFGFFDIYENDEANEEIKNYTTTIRSNTIDSTLVALLPYDTECSEVEEFNEQQLSINNKLNMSRAYNLNSAIVYAERYASSPNETDYDYFSKGDCTNFTSQILEAAGVSQVVYDNENLGWWHKVATGLFGIKSHSHSISWVRARTFAKYMGIGYTTKNHSEFSQNIQKGDFIAYDRNGDGDMDHNAFVVDKDNYMGTYNGKSYYDYKVAQHTGNYCAWTSSTTNSWETLENGTVVYARVRR